MLIVLRLVLILAILHLHYPCCWMTCACSCESGGATKSGAAKKSCPCCRCSPAAKSQPSSLPRQRPQPNDCDDCPCVFCSPGYLPLTGDHLAIFAAEPLTERLSVSRSEERRV